MIRRLWEALGESSGLWVLALCWAVYVVSLFAMWRVFG